MKKALKVIAIILAILLLIGLWLSPWNRIPVPGYREHWPALILDSGDSGLVTAEKGYLYCITGRWKGGGVDYYFFTE